MRGKKGSSFTRSYTGIVRLLHGSIVLQACIRALSESYGPELYQYLGFRWVAR